MSSPTFDGLRVLLLESRRAQEMAAIVASYGGKPVVAPSMREIPLESNPDAIAFADALERNEFDLVILLTGVGARALVAVVERVRGTKDSFVEALRRTRIAARGPKPIAAMRELQVPIWLAAPEPNTWRDVLEALDAKRDELSLRGARVAVQEYGVTNADLIAGLEERGARVTSVPVYKWALPEDLEPLRAGIRALSAREIDVVLFTSANQVVNLLQVAETMELRSAVLDAFANAVVASIGPTTSEELREHGVRADLEPSHPKMGFLVREAAERSADLLRGKRT